MSTHVLPSFFTIIDNALALHTGLHTDHSVVVYTSVDRENFDAHLSPIYGSHSICDLSAVLPDLHTTFLIQVSNLHTRRAIDLVPCTHTEVDLGWGLSMRIVDDARDLPQYPSYEAVFIRADGSLVIWGDAEDATLMFWNDTISRIQNLFATAIPPATTTPVAGLPENDGNVSGGVLSYLEEFADLFNFGDYMPETYTLPSWQHMMSAEPTDGSLGLMLPQRVRSPFSDVTSSSVLDSPFMVDLEGVFPPSVYVGEEDDVGPIFPFSIDELPYSVEETSAPVPFARGIGQKATREDEEAAYYFPQPIINASRPASTSETATGNADVDPRGSASSTRVLKRTHSAMATGSAPARLSTPLPDLQPEEDKRRKFLAILPAPPPVSASGSTATSTPIFAPAPTFPSPTSTSTSTPASGKPQRRTGGNRRRGGGSSSSGGRNARGKRHPCEYCNKTFSRLQDQQRHSTTSCNASPHKATVECPECGAILSRMDAAQRHWRNHENPKCATPDWVSSRS